MKRIILFTPLLFLFFIHVQAQWNVSGDNTTSGRVIISGTNSSPDFDDITITRNKADAGIKIFNSNLSGRSVILFGSAAGGKYGFLTHNAQSYTAGPGYTQVYKPSSTMLVGADVNGLGIISTNDIRFNSGGDGDAALRMVIKANGNVGIGLNNPSSKLEIVGDTPGNGLITMSATGANAYLKVGLNTDYAWIQSYGPRPLRINDVGNNVIFNVGGGSVAIGTPLAQNTNGYKLAVKGKIGAHEVQVENTSNAWADYVFEPDYKLISLDEVHDFIKINKHLPEIPSAEEVKVNGHKLGEMDVLLLKKIEEMTLYVIQQQNQIKILTERLERLESQN